MDNKYYGNDDLITNTSSRLPLCICVDISHSMSFKDGDDVSRFDELKSGMRELLDIILRDDAMRDSVELCVVGFNNEAVTLWDYSTVDSFDINKINPKLGKSSDLGKGIMYALDRCEERKASYKAFHLDYYQPWLVVMTDGKPWGDEAKANYEEAVRRVQTMQKENKLTAIAVLCGGDRDIASVEQARDQEAVAILQRLSDTKVNNFSGGGYRELFRWIGKSMSQSMGGTPKFAIPEFDDEKWEDW